MRRRSRYRRLAVGPDTYRWSVTHRHKTPTPDVCAEVLTLRRDGSPGRVTLVFTSGEDYGVQDGWLHDGAVMRYADGAYLNLHRPGTARAFLDAVLAQGLGFDEHTETEGWPWLDAALSRLTPAS
ncbi:hypothetical protein AB0M28_21630 [Streptomyces sp. NPDC051940]|uniref:hypothetical protein n=1 Tax=Streptomyces sp. NPDC051940 TaxID=3155675 RepID=UPI0034276FE4